MSLQNRDKLSLRTRLSIWWYAFFDRRAFRTRDAIFAASALRLREHYSLPQLGEDETQDHRVRVAIKRFFAWTQESEALHPEDKYSGWLNSDSASQENRRLHYRIQYWLRSFTEDGPKIATHYRALYDEKIQEIDEVTILTEYRRLRKGLNRVRNRYLRSIAIRLPLSIKDFAYSAPILSFLLVVGGYFYTSRIHGHFGIAVNHFFTIGDYLSSSVNAVEAASISAVVAVGTIIVKAVTHINLAKYYREKRAVREKWIRGVLLLSAVYGLIFADESGRATIWFALALCLVGTALLEHLLDRIFRPSLALALLSVSTVVFAAMLYVRSNNHIINIEHGIMDSHFRVVSRDSEYVDDEYSIIGASERYMFLWQREQDQVLVLPRDEIQWMSVSVRIE